MHNRNFDDVLNECFERLLEQESIEDCLRRYPEYAAELRPLLNTYLSAKKAISIQPRPDCKARARFEFQEALHAKFQKKHGGASLWLPRWFTVAASVILGLLVAGSGTAAAAAGSMPDHPLYQVKLATEQVQVAMTPSTVDKAKLYAELADKRVAEIVYLVIKDEGKAEVITQTAEELKRNLEKIADLTLTTQAKPAASGDLSITAPKPVPAQQPTIAAIQPPDKGAVSPPMSPFPQPVPSPDTSAKSPNFSTASTGNASALRIQPTDKTSQKAVVSSEPARNIKNVIPADARARLKAVLESNAANQPSVLSSIIERAPEEAKPAIRRAIEASKDNYKKALSNLE